ncbi:hypothetical protein PRIPAC_79224, partial [Pristionchus pacificus]|uniref:G protein-coupled receptor n=1 Tax=Pristionchus pacificus TaxID=54126 RepID=A0A2A6CL93_PRIPA
MNEHNILYISPVMGTALFARSDKNGVDLRDDTSQLAISVNVMLLRIVFASHRRDVGLYRYLIATFAVSDLSYTIIHYLVYPIPEMHGNAFILGGHGVFNSRLGACVYCAVYSQASPILLFHFVYRTLNLRRFSVMYHLFCPDEETLSNLSPFFSGNTSSPIIHHSETANNYIQALYWRGDTYSGPRWFCLLGALLAMGMIVVTYTVIIVCAVFINKYLRDHVAMSSKTLSLHHQLYISLICQAVYPLITTYFPLSISIFMPVFGINFVWVSLLCPPLCVSHPLFDALVLIFCMTDYRFKKLSDNVSADSRAVEDFSRGLQDVITIISLFVNVMLLRIVVTSRRREIGSYRYLIASFAISDLIYTTVHFLVYPIPEMYGNAFIMSSHGFFYSRLGACIYCGVYTQATPILVFHFVYRTLSIRSSVTYPKLFLTGMLFSAVFMNLNGIFVMSVLFRPDDTTLTAIAPLFAGNTSSPVIHRIETARDHIQALYWSGETFSGPRWANLLGAFDAFFCIAITYTMIVICAILINKFLKEHVAFSMKTLSLHRQLYRSLLCQAIYPLISTYFPLGVCMFMPIIGLSYDWVSVLCPPLCVSHPLFDALNHFLALHRSRKDFSRALQDVITVCSIFVNVMLLRIVYLSHKKCLGSYRYLIASFAISDLIYTSVHFLVYPIPEMYGNSFLLSGHGTFNSRFFACIYCGVYSQATPILVFHFVYRTLNISRFFVMNVLMRPDEETLAANAIFFAGNTSSPVIHRIETAGEHIQALYWSGETFSRPRWKSLIGAFDAGFVIFATYTMIIICAYFISKYLREHVARSMKTLSLHHQLYRSLLCQAIYPFISTYSPLGVCMFMPILGFSFDWVAIFCPPLCVSHPLFDALILIFCMREYRFGKASNCRSIFLRLIGLSTCVRKHRIYPFPSLTQERKKKDVSVLNFTLVSPIEERYT